MVSTYRISKALTTKTLKVDLFHNDRETYLLKIVFRNYCLWLEKKVYISTKLSYKELVKEINKWKKEFDINQYNGNEEWFNKFIVD